MQLPVYPSKFLKQHFNILLHATHFSNNWLCLIFPIIYRHRVIGATEIGIHIASGTPRIKKSEGKRTARRRSRDRSRWTWCARADLSRQWIGTSSWSSAGTCQGRWGRTQLPSFWRRIFYLVSSINSVENTVPMLVGLDYESTILCATLSLANIVLSCIFELFKIWIFDFL